MKVICKEIYKRYDEASHYEYFLVEETTFESLKRFIDDGKVDEEIERELKESLEEFSDWTAKGLANLSKSKRSDVVCEVLQEIADKLEPDMSITSRRY